MTTPATATISHLFHLSPPCVFGIWRCDSLFVLHRIPPVRAMTSCRIGALRHAVRTLPRLWGGEGWGRKYPGTDGKGVDPSYRQRSGRSSVEGPLGCVGPLRPVCGSRVRGPGPFSPVPARDSPATDASSVGACTRQRNWSGGDGPSKTMVTIRTTERSGHWSHGGG